MICKCVCVLFCLSLSIEQWERHMCVVYMCVCVCVLSMCVLHCPWCDTPTTFSTFWFQKLKFQDEPQRSTNRKDNPRSIRIGSPTHTNHIDKSNRNIFQKEERWLEAFRFRSRTYRSITTTKTYNTRLTNMITDCRCD